ncbi:hypothetical protein ACHAPJ_010777 [Fusarium lateritium]
MATEQTLNNVAKAFINVFDTLEADSHVALRAANCMHTFAPSSVNPPPPMSNQDWANHLGKLQIIMTGFPITPKEIHVNVSKSQIVIWATAIPKFKEEVKGLKEGDDGKEWNYVGEFMFILNVDGEGKISRIVEFLDSLGTDRARGLMVRAWDNAGASQKLFEAAQSH